MRTSAAVSLIWPVKGTRLDSYKLKCLYACGPCSKVQSNKSYYNKVTQRLCYSFVRETIKQRERRRKYVWEQITKNNTVFFTVITNSVNFLIICNLDSLTYFPQTEFLLYSYRWFFIQISIGAAECCILTF